MSGTFTHRLFLSLWKNYEVRSHLPNSPELRVMWILLLETIACVSVNAGALTLYQLCDRTYSSRPLINSRTECDCSRVNREERQEWGEVCCVQTACLWFPRKSLTWQSASPRGASLLPFALSTLLFFPLCSFSGDGPQKHQNYSPPLCWCSCASKTKRAGLRAVRRGEMCSDCQYQNSRGPLVQPKPPQACEETGWGNTLAPPPSTPSSRGPV